MVVHDPRKKYSNEIQIAFRFVSGTSEAIFLAEVQYVFLLHLHSFLQSTEFAAM